MHLSWDVKFFSFNPCSKICPFPMSSNYSITPIRSLWGQLSSNISALISRQKLSLFCVSTICLAEALVMDPTSTAEGPERSLETFYGYINSSWFWSYYKITCCDYGWIWTLQTWKRIESIELHQIKFINHWYSTWKVVLFVHV